MPKEDRNIQRLSEAFPPVMHFFHHMAGQVSKIGEYSLAQYRVLMLLHHHERMTVGDLHHALNTAQSTASEMVNRLVKQGLVERERDPDDGRRTVLKLSPGAKKDLLNRMEAMTEVYREILRNFSREEQEELIHSLEEIARILNKKETGLPY
ncbi:MAG TPA: MarR family transcriptional regulator [Caldithrix abyssi]|uniref:MarR family transcriptional regulator n=1 Tax=Caldithrix abyssi TaxID=187145 RepID=A0A7V4WX50_CALAY|nr:MarR family transcriptional regulator [Caldithrix abyssi]